MHCVLYGNVVQSCGTPCRVSIYEICDALFDTGRRFRMAPFDLFVAPFACVTSYGDVSGHLKSCVS